MTSRNCALLDRTDIIGRSGFRGAYWWAISKRSADPTTNGKSRPTATRRALIPARQLGTCNQAVRRNSGPAGAASGPFVTAEAAAIVTAADEIVGVDAGLFPGLLSGGFFVFAAVRIWMRRDDRLSAPINIMMSTPTRRSAAASRRASSLPGLCQPDRESARASAQIFRLRRSRHGAPCGYGSSDRERMFPSRTRRRDDRRLRHHARRCRERPAAGSRLCRRAPRPRPAPNIYLEQRVFFPTIPGAFGTCDLLVRIGSAVHVIDFKFGTGVRVLALYPVGAEDIVNAQLMFYGAAVRHSMPEFFAGVDHIVLTILQPMSIEPDAEMVSSVEVIHAELDEFIAIYRAACEEALSPAPRLERGDHCRFCPARPICPAHTGPLLDLAQFAVRRLRAPRNRPTCRCWPPA